MAWQLNAICNESNKPRDLFLLSLHLSIYQAEMSQNSSNKFSDQEHVVKDDQTTILSLINEGFNTIPSIPNYQYLKGHLLELNLHSNALTSV